MRKRFIYICSPLRGDVEKNITKAQGYCREAARLFPDVIPIAPHVYCTQFLDDTIPDERAVGMELGISLLDICDEIWVYGLDNPSAGMRAEIEYAEENGIPIRDAAEVYRSMEPGAADQPTDPCGITASTLGGYTTDELGDALLVFPPFTGGKNGIPVIELEPQTVRLSGKLIMDMAKLLKRNKGQDLTVEAEA